MKNVIKWVLLVMVTIQLSAQKSTNVLDRSITMTVNSEKVANILKRIEKQESLVFVYSNNFFDQEKITSLSVVDKSLRDILNTLFEGENLAFKVLGNRVIINLKQEEQNTLTQTVRGTVRDAESYQPILGVNIFIPNSDPLIGATTDNNGQFKIANVPVGRYFLQLTSMGYKPRTLVGITVNSGKEVVLNIYMEESVTALDDVTIEADIDKSQPLNEMALVSARSFSVEETSKYAGSFQDPSRMATTYAGVTGSTEDTENGIIIRGNSPKGLLWRIEGMEVPNPNHFADAASSSGSISMLNSNVLANSDFMTGAFPAEYGNAYSGVFDLKLRNGNNEKREFAFQAGLLGVDASFEGPIKRNSDAQLSNASYLVNYRYSTIKILQTLGMNLVGEGESVPAFQDLAFKVNLPTQNFGTFSIYGLGGTSSASDNNYIPVGATNYYVREEEQYRMGLLGLSNIYNISKSAFLESKISTSYTQYTYLQEDLHYNENTQVTTEFSEDDEDYQNSAFRISSTLNQKFNARHSTKIGMIYSLIGYNLDALGRSDPNTITYKEIDNGNMNMYQGFLSHKINVSDRVSITGGFHYLRLDLANQTSFEPRFGLKWQFKKDQSLSLGFGVHSRREDTSVYLREISFSGTFSQPNRNLDLAKAIHYVVGYDRNFSADFHLRLEAYYQDLYNVPISSNPQSNYSILNQENGFYNDALINKGTGENYGIELTLEKFLSKSYFFMLTGSLYQSTYTTLKGIKFNTRYNGNYKINFVAGKEFAIGRAKGKNKSFRIGVETVFAGGARIAAVDEAASKQAGRIIYNENSPFGRRVKGYERLDFQMALKVNKRKTTHELILDVQNLSGKLNITSESYDLSSGRYIASGYVGDLIPVLSYKITF